MINGSLVTISKGVLFASFLLLQTAECFSQDYDYDANGNLSKDPNKKIQSIHYNYLNLADTITFEDGRKIIYMYSASGDKLQQRVIEANGNVAKKSDYLRAFIYQNDTLRQLRRGDGRTVPILAGNPASPWEYQYEQTDHLMNVRTLLTSRQDADNNKATFEAATINIEQNQFQRFEDARKVSSTLFDHTKTGASGFSQRLNGSANEKYGLAKSLSVMPGDVVNLEVFAKYVDQDASHWLPLLTTLMTQVTNGATGIVVDGSGYSSSGTTPIPFVGLNGTSSDADAGPKAYLNWLVFDENFQFKNGGYVKMKASAKENGSNVPHDQLSKQLTINERGFVYVYLSNEQTSPVDVFFDDFTVELVKGPVIQQTDYDSFGLVLTETTREHAEPNNFLNNGKELQQDFDLNWSDYGARMYDAALGRWHVIDPLAERYSDWSTYNYVMNNPVKFSDPDGRNARLVIDKEAKLAYIQANYYVYSYEKDVALDAIGVWAGFNNKETISINGVDYKLSFALSVNVVSGVDKEEVADADPIGNSIEITDRELNNAYGEPDAGQTYDNHILMSKNPKGMELAHEIGHTLLGLSSHEHIEGTILDEAAPDIKDRINKIFVQKVRQTYGIVKNPYPSRANHGVLTREDGTVETIEAGEHFEVKILPSLPKIDPNKPLTDYFPPN